jgi:YesN/AraC family two-component response regulator
MSANANNANDVPRYLIADDSPLSLKWLSKILQSMGPCEIVEAGDGLEAVRKLASEGERIDAIISDLRMPNMNGLELLKEVRLAKTSAPQNIPFFIVTGFAERSLAGLALGLDVDAFLARPVKKQALNRHLIRTSGELRAAKSPAEALATYGDVDPTLDALLDESLPAAAAATPTAPAATQTNGSVAALDERLAELESVPEGALLARDAVNSAGAVLLRAGETMTGSLKAVLMSYAEIDESLAKVWVAGATESHSLPSQTPA